MVADLRLETGRSANVNFGQDEYQSLTRILQRTQNDLYWDYEWPFLRVRRDVTTQAGERYYDFPSDMDPERIIKVRVKYGNVWFPVTRGIGMNEYTVLDSDNDVRQDPVEKWETIDAGDGEQFEMWPMPATDDLTVRFLGFKKLGDFISDDSVCTLDNNLIVLFAAAKILAREKAEDAKEALAAANKLYNNLKRGGNRSEMPTPMTGISSSTQESKGVVVIAPRPAGS